MILSTKGFAYLATREIVQIVAPYTLALRDESSSSCHLVTRDSIQEIYRYIVYLLLKSSL
jgi:IclR family pca regulon transcriptional regulator